MTVIVRENFATQANAETLGEVRRIAEAEGRQIQALVDEALSDWLENRHKRRRPRAYVMEAYQRSLEPYGELYKKLAQ